MKALLTELRRIADALERLAPNEAVDHFEVESLRVGKMRDLHAASEAQRAVVTGVR